jgi:hypothetical protein
MLENFKSMPTFLKLFTFHGFGCSILFLVSVMPRDHFSIDGRAVTYAEWWSSGLGVIASVLGLAMTLAAWLFITKRPLGRVLYLACFGGTLILSLLFSREFIAALMGFGVTVVLARYLFVNQAVCSYFFSNSSFKADASGAA